MPEELSCLHIEREVTCGVEIVTTPVVAIGEWRLRRRECKNRKISVAFRSKRTVESITHDLYGRWASIRRGRVGVQYPLVCSGRRVKSPIDSPCRCPPPKRKNQIKCAKQIVSSLNLRGGTNPNRRSFLTPPRGPAPQGGIVAYSFCSLTCGSSMPHVHIYAHATI
jgi:hypothetical protein